MFLNHAARLFDGTAWDGAAGAVGPQGVAGVSFFFVLSGFVLAWSHREGDTARQFYRRRFARIVPAYWVACVAVAVVPALTYDPIGSIREAATRVFPVTFLQSWVPLRDVYFGGNTVSWSLSDEWFFYALFPLIAVALLRARQTTKWRWLAGLVVLAVGVPLAVHVFWLVIINPAFRVAEFVLGMCLAGLLRDGLRLRIPVVAAAALTLAGYVAAGIASNRYAVAACTLVPFCVLIFATAEADLASRGPRLLRSATLIRLGQWSFAFYLVHALVVSLADHLTQSHAHSTGLRLAAFVLAYGASIGTAYGLFRLVEHPLELRLRRGGTAVPRSEVALAAAGDS